MNSQYDLARNFGYDITMSDGHMGLPSAAHKEYMERCQFLYKEFMTNMNIHMKNEKELKKELRALHREKMQHLRFSLYRSSSTDPFSRHDVVTASSLPLESRNNTPWGLNTIPDNEDQVFRPHTAPTGTSKWQHANTDRPKTAAVDSFGNILYNNSDEQSDDNLSEVSSVSQSTIVGIIDRKMEQSSARKISVGQQSFNKIGHGKVRAKIKNKDGRFLVQPINIEYDVEAANQDNQAFEPSITKQQFDPLYERLALVRKITDFKSPTISSDMKINNRVPIQKSLKGIKAKRTTVSEIYQNARDRKTRHFRIVAIKPKINVSGKPTVSSVFRAALSSVKNNRTNSSERGGNSRLSNNQEEMGGATQGAPNIFTHRPNSQVDEIDSVASANRSRPRSILHSISSGSRGLDDSLNAANNAFMNVLTDIRSRPQSKVAFARSDSRMSSGTTTQLQADDKVDLSASFASSTGGGGSHFGSKLAAQKSGKRRRTISANSETNEVPPGEFRSCSTSQSQVDVINPPNSTDGAPRGRLGLTSADLRARGLARSESRQSVSSAETSNSFIAKVKEATDHIGKSGGKPVSQKLGFRAPQKMESSRDTKDIVRQQIRQDRQLDETMTVWRRRMAIKSSVMSPRAVGLRKSSSRLR